MTKAKKILSNNTYLTLMAMVIGAVLGLVYGKRMSDFKFIGDIWLDCIKMILIPLIFCMMVTSIAGQKDAKKLGRISVRIMGFYLISTVLSGIFGFILAYVIKPGLGVSLEGLAVAEVSNTVDFSAKAFFTGLFSDNMFGTFASGNFLQTMIIAIMLGMAILKMKNQDHKEFLLKAFRSVNDMISAYIGLIIKFTPIGVCFLIADSFGLYGFSIFTTMAGLIGTFWLGIVILFLVFYGGTLWAFAKVNLFAFLKKSMPVWTFTLATCSSSASVPVVIKSAKEDFKIPDDIAEFCLSLGSQVNSHGNAILYPLVLVFMSQLYGIPIDLGTIIQMLFVSTLINFSGGGLPGGGPVKLLVVVTTFGFPPELVGVIAGFYRFFDMPTTTANTIGDLVGTIYISKWEENSLVKERAKTIKA